MFLKNPGAAVRLVNAESDGLPGLVVDRYADFMVCQFLSAGMEHWKEEIVKALEELLPVAGIYERSDVATREKEGLATVVGLLSGAEPPELVEIEEGPLRFLVDVKRGHKTGFYLDQRDNRAMVPEFSQGEEVLNCFSYSGGFGLRALKGGAEGLTNIDASAEAVGLVQENMGLNRLDSGKCENLTGDVFHLLRKFRDQGRSFGVIILDPPKFAESGSQVDGACRGYKDINLLAFKLLKPGGVLFTFSCSGHVGLPLFQKIVADAALDAGRDAQIIRYLGQAADHPIGLPFPEGQYLKGFICKAL
jgi:23S rRNA (cytosine1962-C5)-methyltransferase